MLTASGMFAQSVKSTNQIISNIAALLIIILFACCPPYPHPLLNLALNLPPTFIEWFQKILGFPVIVLKLIPLLLLPPPLKDSTMMMLPLPTWPDLLFHFLHTFDSGPLYVIPLRSFRCKRGVMSWLILFLFFTQLLLLTIPLKHLLSNAASLLTCCAWYHCSIPTYHTWMSIPFMHGPT